MDVWMNLISFFLQQELCSWFWSRSYWFGCWVGARVGELFWLTVIGGINVTPVLFFFSLQIRLNTYLSMYLLSKWKQFVKDKNSQKLDWTSPAFFFLCRWIFLLYVFIIASIWLLSHSCLGFFNFLHSSPVRHSFSCSFFETACEFGTTSVWFKPCNPHIAGGLKPLMRSPTHSLLIILCIIV